MSSALGDLPTQDVDIDDDLALQAVYHAEDLTDGLPIVVPTPERVEAFIDASGFDRATEVGPIAPARGVATVGNVAVNSLMAGARPEHLGVVLGAIEAMLEERFHLHGIQTTTNPVAPLALINGPIQDRLDIASGRNALAPGQSANGPIGRAIRFVLRNVGGARGDVDRATLGWPMKYTFCLAEAEHDSPWEPLSESLGFELGADVVTMVPVESFVDIIPVFKTSEPLIDHFARVMRAGGTGVYWSRGTCLLVVNPGHARILAEDGYDRRKLQERLFEEAMIPLADMPHGNIPQGDWTVVGGKVLLTESPDDIYIAVAGGPEPYHTVFMTAFGVANACSARVWAPDR